MQLPPIRSVRSIRSILPHPSIVCMLLAPAVALVACAPGHDSARARATSERLVDTTTPESGPSLIGVIPPLGVSGAFVQKDSKGKYSATGQFTDGRDLLAAPGTDPAPWRKSVIGDGQSTSTPAFDTAIANALTAADTHENALTSGAFKSVFDGLAALPFFSVSTGAPTHEFTGYAPMLGRWLTSVVFSSGDLTSPMSITTYDDPAELAEQRERGARLYCAARQAQFQQGATTTPMGELTPFSVKLLGKTIDLLVVEPTAVLNGPQRFTTGLAGAQGFEVPMLLGTRLTVLRGLGTIGLDEMRAPVVLVTGDTEVSNSVSPSSGETRGYMTVRHADGIGTATEGASASFTIPLMKLGVVSVGLDATLEYGVGKLTRNNDRVLVPPTGDWPGVWPTTRAGKLGVNGAGAGYHDGAWSWPDPCKTEIWPPCPPRVWTVRDDGLTDPFWTVKPADQIAMNTRALEDDDHVIDVESSLKLGTALKAAFGLDVGIVKVAVTTSGGISGTVGQHHVVRDALGAQKLAGATSALGATMLTVRPRTTADVSISGGVNLELTLNLGFWKKTRVVSILDFGSKTLAKYDTDVTGGWGEETNLRIGTGSSSGDVMKQPTVSSHLPQGSDFTSFPASVDACLADATLNPATPPICKRKPVAPVPEQASFCAITSPHTGATFPVCSDIPGAVALSGETSDRAQCLLDYYAMLCEPVSYEGGGVLSHVLDISDPATMTRYGNIQAQCLKAFVPLAGPIPTPAEEAAMTSFLESRFMMGVCTPAAVPISKDDLTVTPAGDPSKPAPAKPSGPCL